MDPKLATALISGVLIVIALALIVWGWNNRKKRQSDWGRLAEVPARYESIEPLAVFPGTYVATTSEGDWLDRIAVDSLGYKAVSHFFVFSDAVLIAREGSRDIWIPAEDLTGVRTESGMSGKFVEKDGLVVVTWNFNGKAVDTGFRTRYAEDKGSLLEAIQTVSDQPLASR